MNIEKMNAIVTAKSSIAHGQILSEQASKSRKVKNFNRLARETFVSYVPIYEEEDVLEDGKKTGKKQVVERKDLATFDLPIISGNSIRGEARTLLTQFTYDDVLDLDILKIATDQKLGKSAERLARFTLQLLYKGGVTPGKCKIEYTPCGMYEKITNAIPTLSLLGGVMGAHHFSGALRVSSMIPATAETFEMFKSEFPNEKKPDLLALTLNRSTNQSRYAKHESVVTSNEGNGLTDDTDIERSKTKMLFGQETIPAGTRFYFMTECTSDNEGTLLAYRAFNALLARHSYVGAMSGKGHGRVTYEFDTDLSHALEDYEKYLVAHKDTIVEAISQIPANFRFKIQKDDDESEGDA